jgi:spore maturation protein CgeB
MITSWLKRFKLLRSLNGRLKSRKLNAQYAETVAYYAGRKELPLNVERARRTKVLVTNWARPGFKIFFAGTDEQQDKSGFLQALQRLGEVRCFVREDGSWGQNDPASYAQRRANNSRRLEELFASNAKEEWVPHLLIMQTWACLIEPACLSRLRSRYGVFIANVSMDDRHQYWGTKVSNEWDGAYSLIPHIDVTLTAAPEVVSWYHKEGGAAIYFPEASDPVIFQPMSSLAKIHDVSFVGARYGIRGQIVKALREAGVIVSAYGVGWEYGRIDTKDVPVLFAQSKIVLGVGTIGYCDDFYALKLRDFDAPMSGSCYVTHDNPDLHDLYEMGSEIVGYKSVNDCVVKVRNLLVDDMRRETIGAAGRARALKQHTWDHRFSELFSRLSVDSMKKSRESDE